MKYKYAILIGMSSLLSGFIPLSITKPKDIVFTIFTTSIPKATQIKERQGHKYDARGNIVFDGTAYKHFDFACVPCLVAYL